MDETATSLVVATKLGVPETRPQTVARDRLTELLDAVAAQRPLTVVCAPAGYGKTTALATWLERAPGAVAWLALDARDADRRQLCADVLAAVDHALPGSMAPARQALMSGADLHDTVLPLAVNALVEQPDDELTLVLDDYHTVRDDRCHGLLVTLLADLPPNVRVVVSSRTLPPLRLGRRRAAGTLAEIGPDELRLRRAETEELLNEVHRLGLDARALEAIEERVAGWPAGLALVAAAIADQDDVEVALAQAQANIATYVTEEMLDAVDPPLREVLRRTSILRRLDAELVAAVLDVPSAAEWMAQLRDANLATVVDHERGSLRYHALFAALLERELRAGSPELVPELHRRAGAWLELHGPPDEALRHAVAAGDGPLAARILRERLRVDPGYGDLARAAADGRAAWRRHGDAPGMRTALGPPVGVVLWFAGDRDGTREVLEDVVDAIAEPVDRRAALAALALAAADEGDVESAERYAREAVEGAAGDGGHSPRRASRGNRADDAARGADVPALAFVALGEMLRLRGALEDAEAAVARAARISGRAPGSVEHALTLIAQAQLSLAARDRRRARTRAASARRIVDRQRDAGVLADRLAAVEQALERRSDDELLGSRPTPAELRLLALLPSDLTLRRIAEERLVVSIHTVTSHARRLYRRLGVRTREEAVVAARERGLL